MDDTTNERRRTGATAHEAALSELVSLARDLGIPASMQQDEPGVRGLATAIRDRIGMKARSLAFACRDIGTATHTHANG